MPERLKRRIKDCENAKERLKEIVEVLNELYEKERISFLQYKTRLNGILKGRSFEDWLKYYDKEIKDRKNQLKAYGSRNFVVLVLALLVVFGLWLFLKPNVTSYISMESSSWVNDNIILWEIILIFVLVILNIVKKLRE